MHVKTVEGLVGTRMYTNLTEIPMRIYKEASHRGDTAAMERALGYADKFTDKVGEYKSEAGEGLEEDAKEAKEKAKEACEEAAKKRREERIQLEKRMEEAKQPDSIKTAAVETDTVEVSEEGRELLKAGAEVNAAESGGESDGETDGPAKEPVFYTKTGETGRQEQGRAVDVSC